MSSVEECMTESWEDHGGVVLYMFICMYVFYGFEVRIYCVWQIVLFFFFFLSPAFHRPPAFPSTSFPSPLTTCMHFNIRSLPNVADHNSSSSMSFSFRLLTFSANGSGSPMTSPVRR